MNNTQCCVIDADNYYVDLFSVYEDGEKVLHVYGYTMQPGDRMLDVSQPLKRLHAGGAGFVKPRWDEDTAAWVEGATAEELAAWEAKHPAPEVDLDTLRAAKQEQNKQALADWLAAHPLTWTDGNVYGVTEQDQNEMAINLAQYQLAVAAEQPAVLEWHAQKKQCAVPARCRRRAARRTRVARAEKTVPRLHDRAVYGIVAGHRRVCLSIQAISGTGQGRYLYGGK